MGEQEQDTKVWNGGMRNGTKVQKSKMGEREARCKLLLEFAWRCREMSGLEIPEMVLELLGSNTFDQYDKWMRFSLRLHIGIESFTGVILWLIIWWSNSNPKLVVKQYFNTARCMGGRDKFLLFIYLLCLIFGAGIPLVTQSDHGTENYNIAYAHTSICHKLDPNLAGTLQHNFMRGHTNIKPGRAWGRLRDTWSKGFENMLNEGIKNQWYDTSNVVGRYG